MLLGWFGFDRNVCNKVKDGQSAHRTFAHSLIYPQVITIISPPPKPKQQGRDHCISTFLSNFYNIATVPHPHYTIVINVSIVYATAAAPLFFLPYTANYLV